MDKEKVRIVILKETETEKGKLFRNINEEKFNMLDLGFDWGIFHEQVKHLISKNLLTKPQYASNIIFNYTSRLTGEGEEYLKNSKWYRKLYKTLKEIKFWIK